MPNTFKSSVQLNVATGGGSTIYTVPASTQTIAVGLMVANKTASGVTLTVNFGAASTVALISGVIVPPNSTLVVIGKDEKLIMQATNTLVLIAGTASSLDATFSYLEIS